VHRPASSALPLCGSPGTSSPSARTLNLLLINSTHTCGPKIYLGGLQRRSIGPHRLHPPRLPCDRGQIVRFSPHHPLQLDNLVIPSKGDPSRNSWLDPPSSYQHSKPSIRLTSISLLPHIFTTGRTCHPTVIFPKANPTATHGLFVDIKRSNKGLLGSVIGRIILLRLSQYIEPLARTSGRIVGPSGRACSASPLGCSETIYRTEKQLSTASRHIISSGAKSGARRGAHNPQRRRGLQYSKRSN